MTTTAIVFMILAMVIVWGGLLASVAFLIHRPELKTWPAGDPTED
ncbi:MAG: methionine/alanine import family NSS transporter small subunit [Propionibacteriaceae bacterium]|jgi:hypothetical protein|nr:methionine/alanine import family NSS transporter small subunit [Propionibacteriaceae bacterium]